MRELISTQDVRVGMIVEVGTEGFGTVKEHIGYPYKNAPIGFKMLVTRADFDSQYFQLNGIKFSDDFSTYKPGSILEGNPTLLVKSSPEITQLVHTQMDQAILAGKLPTPIEREGLIRKPSGADPEVFVVDKDNKVIPAWKFLPSRDEAEKKRNIELQNTPNPERKRSDTSDRYHIPLIFWDGWQAEGTTPQNTCCEYLTDYVRAMLKEIRNAAVNFNPSAKLTPLSTLPCDPQDLIEGDHKYVEFGCSPSLNIYNSPGLPCNNGRNVPIRFSGSHKHFGYRFNTEEQKIQSVKALDRIYGVAFISLAASFDDPNRRRYYGRAGEVRWPSHGLEYRTPSSLDLCAPEIYHLSWDLARVALNVGYGHDKLFNAWQTTDEETMEVINNTDVKGAREILDRNKVLFRNLLNTLYYSNRKVTDKAILAWTQGVETVIKDPFDMSKNWWLNNNEWKAQSHHSDKTFSNSTELL